MRSVLVWSLAAVLITAPVIAQSGMTGQWTESTGSVIRVDRCDSGLCMWVVSVSRAAPATVDIYNPDPSKRHRSLCGLQIGSGFEIHGQSEARKGTLYDPKSGKSYHGTMKLNGDKLQLRGYVGIPLFGETQAWWRPATPISACSSANK